MPFSQVDICNKALTKIGAQRIVAITDDTKAAKSLRAIWDMQRDVELAAHPWSFAMTRVQLPALLTAPDYGWARSFQLPADCLRIVEVGENWTLYLPSEAGEFFQIEGTKILCDESSPLRMRYIKQVTNTGEFPALFAEALACGLAAELALDSTDSQSDRKSAWDEYAVAISQARRANAIEKPPQRIVEDEWTLAMRGWAG